MKHSLFFHQFNIKIPWIQGKTKHLNMLFGLNILLFIVSKNTVSLQQIVTSDENLNNKRSVYDSTTFDLTTEDSTTAVIQKHSISDDAYSKISSNCPSLDRKIYKGHSPVGFLSGLLNSTKITYEKVPNEKSSTLDECMDECCNQQKSCQSIFAFSNDTILNCFMLTCEEGKYCLPSKSTKNVENSTTVVLLRPPSGVSMRVILQLDLMLSLFILSVIF